MLALVDSGGANIGSVRYALARLGVETTMTSDWDVIRKSERVILPGVGAAGAAMAVLDRHGLTDRLARLTQPVLGICLGMQLLFDGSDEDNTRCLGVIPGRARLLPRDEARRVPHMGWNALHIKRDHALLDRLPEDAHAYFVHSYAIEDGAHTLATTSHGIDFCAMAGHHNFVAAQFHPERSASTGRIILENFLRL